MAETAYYDSTLTGAELDEAFRRLASLEDSVAAAADAARTAESWADQAQQIARGYLGWFRDTSALTDAHPTAEAGQWALVGSTASLWLWDTGAGAFVDSAGRLYRAAFPLEGWSGSGPCTQTVALTPVDGGPPVTAGSRFAGPPLCEQTESPATNRTLLRVLGLFNEGSARLGSGTVAVTLSAKPTTDIEVWWSIRKGE